MTAAVVPLHPPLAEPPQPRSAGSPMAEFGWQYWERNICVVPIAPGTKRPGDYSFGKWHGMRNWDRFQKRLPTEIEIREWEGWPDAGIGVVLGEVSGLVALDRDYDSGTGADDALGRLIPYSSFEKKGEKGWTRFFRYSGERSCSFNVNGVRVLDVLAGGRQTVMPPTLHPSGMNYVWTGPDRLWDVPSVETLPQLPADFLEQVAAVLAPYQNEDDLHQRSQVTLLADRDRSGAATARGYAAEYFDDVSRAALARLEDWVPRLIPGAVHSGEGWRCVATWRNGEHLSVGIHPNGIRDFAGGENLTPITLVMRACGLTRVTDAAGSLSECLRFRDTTPIVMTVGGRPMGAPLSEPVVAEPLLPPPVTGTLMLPPTTSPEPAPALPSFITDPPGILHTMADWITATSPKAQPELSLAGAIALGAACTQRIYVSDTGSYTSLYVVMVARSTEGKERPQGALQQALAAAGLDHLIGGSGYTSAGAVYSELLAKPSHVTTIDEMGKLLKFSRGKGNSHAEAAIDKLVEAFGRLGGVMTPPTYSTMTLPKKQTQAVGSAAETEDPNRFRVIHNPAITILGATTPGTFYGSLTDDLVHDGFLGRLLVVPSTRPRQIADLRRMRGMDPGAPPPRQVIEWCQAVNRPALERANLLGLTGSMQPAPSVVMAMDDACIDMLEALDRELMALKDQYEAEGLDVLLGRTLEKSARLSIIAAKARDAAARRVTAEDMRWAIQYVRHYDLLLVEAVKRERTESETDRQMKKLAGIVGDHARYFKDAQRGLGEFARYASVFKAGAVPRQMIVKKMKIGARELDQLIDTAVEAGMIRPASSGVALGYPGNVYYPAGGAA